MSDSPHATLHFTLDGQSIPYRLRVSSRCRRMGLRFSDRGLEVVAPPRLKDLSPDFLFQRFSGWIRRQMRRHHQRRAAGLALGGRLLLRGRPLRLEIREGALAGFCHAGADGDWLWIETAPGALVEAAHAVRAFLFEEARRDLHARLAVRRTEMEQAHGEVRVRELKSLWGSCAPRSGKLLFNAKLVMAPPDVLDYIVVHELAHFRWARHGARFWERVARFCPDFRRHRRWLRDNAWMLEIPSTADDLTRLLAPAPPCADRENLVESR